MTPPRSLRVRSRHARGMTLLEVVVSVLILGLVASAIASVMAYTLGQQGYNELRLGAYEVGNRLMIQYLDDDSVLKSTRGRPIEYNGRRYAWDYGVDKVEMKVKQIDPSSGRAGPRQLARFELVTVRVWLERFDGRPGAAQTQTGEPLAVLTRLLDPVAPRNPDAMARLSQDPNRMMEMVNRVGIGPSGDRAPTNTPTPPGSGNRGRNGTGTGGNR